MGATVTRFDVNLVGTLLQGYAQRSTRRVAGADPGVVPRVDGAAAGQARRSSLDGGLEDDGSTASLVGGTEHQSYFVRPLVPFSFETPGEHRSRTTRRVGARNRQGLAWVLAVPALVALAALAGCAGTERNPAESFLLYAAWGDWPGDPTTHLFLTIVNEGQTQVDIGPGGHDVEVFGPTGVMPISWDGSAFSRPVYPDQSITVAFHPRTLPTSLFTFTLDHASGVPTPPPVGWYQVCVDPMCERLELAP